MQQADTFDPNTTYVFGHGRELGDAFCMALMDIAGEHTPNRHGKPANARYSHFLTGFATVGASLSYFLERVPFLSSTDTIVFLGADWTRTRDFKYCVEGALKGKRIVLLCGGEGATWVPDWIDASPSGRFYCTWFATHIIGLPDAVRDAAVDAAKELNSSYEVDDRVPVDEAYSFHHHFVHSRNLIESFGTLLSRLSNVASAERRKSLMRTQGEINRGQFYGMEMDAAVRDGFPIRLTLPASVLLDGEQASRVVEAILTPSEWDQRHLLAELARRLSAGTGVGIAVVDGPEEHAQSTWVMVCTSRESRVDAGRLADHLCAGGGFGGGSPSVGFGFLPVKHVLWSSARERTLIGWH
ncbi:hypothetical protein QKT49_gp422 [Acanthamoeba castellanii medusavirus]|uniref:Uncharacterized protein n=1 Tax=Acanthamoeba castellanii medusavirus J1 TaxID=3114988 RepID=A0A3T1CWZ1_9VIRU|nr:hypothetical protein QKT49_gp422 [Acanthamoeba castellanii medusavirus]BBI30341.1 hypothetical protein [Acanthamoeba castellanii medusavirus J1]